MPTRFPRVAYLDAGAMSVPSQILRCHCQIPARKFLQYLYLFLSKSETSFHDAPLLGVLHLFVHLGIVMYFTSLSQFLLFATASQHLNSPLDNLNVFAARLIDHCHAEYEDSLKLFLFVLLLRVHKLYYHIMLL